MPALGLDLAPGLENLMVGSAPPHLEVITLPMGLTDSCAHASKVRSILPVPSAFPQRSLPWALQTVKLAGSFYPYLRVNMATIIVERGRWCGCIPLAERPQLYS